MKLINTLVSTLLVAAVAQGAIAEEVKNVRIGNAEIAYNYETTETGMAILTLIALVAETNNSLRGLKNTDRQRLGKLGQLIYQCKLMLYKPDSNGGKVGVNDPVLVSKNYSLFTGVDLSLATDERMGIQVQALQAVDDGSLFSPTLGEGGKQKDIWETVGEGEALNLDQFSVNLLKESNIIESAESIDVVVRFPVFQLEKPVRQWSYNFGMSDFKQAVRHTDENCTPARLMEFHSRQS